MKLGNEKAHAKLKAFLRAKAERTVVDLWNTVGPIVPLLEPQECANYFKSCGYDPEYSGRALIDRKERPKTIPSNRYDRARRLGVVRMAGLPFLSPRSSTHNSEAI